MQIAFLAVNPWKEDGERIETIWQGKVRRQPLGDFEIDLPKNILVLLSETQADKALRVRSIPE